MSEVEYRIKIKDLPKDERPRERLAKFGAESLSTSELLAIILRTGSHGETALDTANKLLNKHDGNIKSLFFADITELSKIRGIGFAKAVQLKAVFELAKRIQSFTNEKTKVSTPEDVANLLMPKMRSLDKEHLVILCLDPRNRILNGSEVTISIGSLDMSIIDPKEVFKVALAKNAASIILAHNHPSGDPSPSSDDLRITKRLMEAGDIMGIGVLDHIIFGDGEYISLKNKGLI
ncbi:MAG: DNA repair protein RadC [Methanosarcinales archaeon Met12]|nr:MAG: DNA repair protein RadC [Methanosarcinales archaeon Met12]